MTQNGTHVQAYGVFIDTAHGLPLYPQDGARQFRLVRLHAIEFGKQLFLPAALQLTQ